MNIMERSRLIRYEDWLAKEYTSAGELGSELEHISDILTGRTVTEFAGDPSDGAVLFAFGRIRLYIWPGEDAVKIRICGMDIPGIVAGDAGSETSEKITGMAFSSICCVPDPSGRCGRIALSFEKDGRVTAAGISSEGISISEAARGEGGTLILSEKKMAGADDRYLRRIRTADGSVKMSVVDGSGSVIVPPVYSSILLMSIGAEYYKVSRMTPRGEVCGACDGEGNVLVECAYEDLFLMANGFFLVMDARSMWWVIDEKNEAVFGPSVYGVDIYGNSRDYLFNVEYYEPAQCECLGIYDVSLRTVTCSPVFTKIRYIGDGRFDAVLVHSDGTRSRETVDRFGNVCSGSNVNS